MRAEVLEKPMALGLEQSISLAAIGVAVAICGLGWYLSFRARRNANQPFWWSWILLTLVTSVLVLGVLAIDVLVGRGIAGAFR
jgi:hypothetical protein